MRIYPITGALGASVQDIDLNNLTDGLREEIETAFHKHLVLVFPDQCLTASDLLALTHQLGGPGETPYLQGLADYPDVVPIIKEASELSPVSFGSGWHTDFTFQSAPPSRTLLYAQQTPPHGGDTLFTNLYLAYNALSEGLKSLLGPLNSLHSATRSYGPNSTLQNQLENMVITKETEEPPEQAHPVIRVHDVTGQPALWVNPTYTLRFENMTTAESKPLLEYLNHFVTQPSFTCRVRWQPQTLVMWDNRCTQHCATSDYHGYRRAMLRTTVKGARPKGLTG